MTLAMDTQGKDILTIEGLADPECVLVTAEMRREGGKNE